MNRAKAFRSIAAAFLLVAPWLVVGCSSDGGGGPGRVGANLDTTAEAVEDAVDQFFTSNSRVRSVNLVSLATLGAGV